MTVADTQIGAEQWLKMSGWDAFIAAMQQVGVTHGCIMSRENGALWAATAGFTLDNYEAEVSDETGEHLLRVSIQEHPRLLHVVNNEGVAPDEYGIYLAHKKYFRVNFDSEKRSIYLKSKDGYACIAFTEKAFVYGSWVGLPPGPLNERIEYLAGEIAKAGF